MFWFIIFLSLALNILYYFVSQKLKIKIFSWYFIGFILYSSLIFSLIMYLKLDIILINFFSFFVIYILFFISLFFKHIYEIHKEPYIFNFQNFKEKSTKKQIIKKLEKQKILEIRIKDLEKQNILKVKNKKMMLKENLGLIINLFFFLKKFLNVKSEG